MRYLVTGGAGFIGSHLVEALVARGDDVRVLDDLSTGHVDNLAGVRGRVDLRTGDITDMDAVRAAMEGVELVVHLAARLSVPESVEQPDRYHQTNITGTFNVLLSARDAGVRRVVCASSAAVYGVDPPVPSGEDDPTAPASPYGFTKLVDEQYCRLFTQVYDLPTVSLRYFNVYGPRQRPDSGYAGVITRFCARLSNGEPPVIYGDGLQSRDFVYVSDVVRATIAASEHPGAAGQVINVGTGQSVTIRELAATLSELYGVQREPTFAPGLPGDVRHSRANVERARSLLGFEAATPLAEGLAATVAWHGSR